MPYSVSSLQYSKPATLLSTFILLFTIMYGKTQTLKPNVIIILADDIGYDVPTVNGGQSYSTPNIDYLATHGMNFKHCEASPLCSPSRFMLLTGKYNFRNYSIWGWMNEGEKTIGNIMKGAGYRTGFFGKLQLYSHDSDIHNMGFDDYLVLEAINRPGGKYRYKNPVLYKNGEIPLPDSLTHNKYADDILTQRIFDFIDSNKNRPFFAYYPMSVCHTPLSPTPDDTAFARWDPSQDVSDTSYFRSMVKYMDKKIGQIRQKLKNEGLDKNTILIFCGDNGTAALNKYIFNDIESNGEKATTKEGGTHVPLMIYWPGHIKAGTINDDLVDFTDFMPTLAEAAGNNNLNAYAPLDGRSFYPRLLGKAGHPRDWIFCHFDAWPGFYGTDTLNRWVQNANYKLYDKTGSYYSGNFYNILADKAQEHPLPDSILTPLERELKNAFLAVLDTMPKAPVTPNISNLVETDITATSITINASIIASGNSPIKEMGSLLNIYPLKAYFNNKRKSDLLTAEGFFQITRMDLTPQTHYNISLYAMNENRSNNTGYLHKTGGFFTLSSPPKKQPVSIIATKDSCSITFKWTSAKYPASGATQAGYIIIYSTKTPALVEHPNQKRPSAIVDVGAFVITQPAVLPTLPINTVTISNLFSDSMYNFWLIPYTWDGINPKTYNYLTAGALTISASPLPSGITLTTFIKKPLCVNSGDGSIRVAAAGGFAPYFYSINGGSNDTSSTFKNLAEGSYTINVTDAAGCTAKEALTLLSLKPVVPHAKVTNASCFGIPDGSIKLTAAGGTGPYQYSIDGGSYSANSLFNNLLANSYNIVVKDAAGCISSKVIPVTQPKPLFAAITKTNASCIGGSDGLISVAAKGGTAPYMYSLNGGEYGAGIKFNNLTAGNYTVFVKDAHGCIYSVTTTVNQLNKACPSSLLTSKPSVQLLIADNRFKVLVSPNPSIHQFTLTISGNTGETIYISVSDVYGKILYNAEGVLNSKYQFGDSFSAGIYFVKVLQGKNIQTIKIVKAHN